MRKPETLAEIEQVFRRAEEMGVRGQLQTLATVQDSKRRQFPIVKFSMGNPDANAAVLGIIGGVHGLERIGAQVAVAFMNSLTNLALWDQNTRHLLEKIRVFFIPVLNPSGVFNRTRCNGNGVDLMRNAPIEADHPARLLGGHYISKRLPWYRGDKGKLELESQALVDTVLQEISQSSQAITVDLHSGFGMQDQIWFPYAKTAKPFPHLGLLHSLTELFDKTYPYHIYRIQPQAQVYSTHGDLWDYIYDLNLQRNPDASYLPLCLEMGSWRWIKKNPLQLFSATGPYNPIKKHRERRILRRHNAFFDFLLKALSSHEYWGTLNPEQLHKHELRAKERWYKERWYEK